MAGDNKVYGLNIAALILGIVSLVLWCIWFVSMPCAILAIVFGSIGVRKNGKAMGITGIIIGIVSIFIFVLFMAGVFVLGFLEGFTEEYELYDESASIEQFEDESYNAICYEDIFQKLGV